MCSQGGSFKNSYFFTKFMLSSILKIGQLGKMIIFPKIRQQKGLGSFITIFKAQNRQRHDFEQLTLYYSELLIFIDEQTIQQKSKRNAIHQKRIYQGASIIVLLKLTVFTKINIEFRLKASFQPYILSKVVTELMYCPKCKQTLQSKVRIPMVICPKQHLCCLNCIETYFTNSSSKCPECQQKIESKSAVKFRLYEKFQMKMREYEEKHKVNMKKVKTDTVQVFKQMVRIKRTGYEKQLDAFLKGRTLKEMKCQQPKQITNKIIVSIEALKILIENDFGAAEAENFIGLGAYEETTGYCQKQGLQWYSKIYGEENIGSFDLLALCFLILPNYEEAKQWYDEMLKKHPKSHQLLYGKAVTEHNAGNLEQASSIYQQIIDINPQFDRSYIMLALLELGKQNNEAALEYAKNSIDKRKDNMLAEYVLALTAQPYNRDYIRQQLDRIVKAHPEFVRALCKMGDTYAKEGDYQTAKRYYQGCSINKEYNDPKIQLARIDIIQGKANQAQVLFSELLKKALTQEQKQVCLYGMGTATKMQAHYKTATRWFASYAEKSPDQAVQLELAELFCEIGEFRSAIGPCRSYFSQEGGEHRWRVYDLITICYDKIKCKDGVIEWLKKWVEEFPGDYSIFLKIGIFHDNFSMYDDALSWLTACLNEGYRLQEVYPRMIGIYEKQEKEEQAIKMIEEYERSCELTIEECEALMARKAGLLNKFQKKEQKNEQGQETTTEKQEDQLNQPEDQ